MTAHTHAESKALLHPGPEPRRTRPGPGLRGGAVATGLLLGSWASAAVASPPEGWENAVNDSVLVTMLKLVGIPVAVIAVITLLTYLPLIMRGGRNAVDPTSYFSEHSEWFGGPRTAPEAIESRTAPVEDHSGVRGGAGVRW